MKKILAIMLIMAFSLSLLTACGGNNNSQNSGDNNTPSSNSSTATPVGNDTTPSGGNNSDNANNGGKQPGGTEGKLVSGKFSLEYPKGWEFKDNEGDPEAHDPNSDAYIQLTVIGMTADAYFELMRSGDYTKVQKGGYTFKTTESYMGSGLYVYEYNSNTSAVISVYQVDADTLDAVLASFKVN